MLPRLLALIAALFALSGLATQTTDAVIRNGLLLARASISNANPPPPRMAKSPICMLFSYGQTSAQAGFALVAVTPEEQYAGLRAMWFRQLLNSDTGLVQVRLDGKGTLEQWRARVWEMEGLQAEGWLWNKNVFIDVADAVGVVPVERGALGQQVYLEVMRQLGAKEGWVPLG